MANAKPQITNGLISVFTGAGKGKTTAALGLTFRALGHGQRVFFIQFIKGKWKTGEANLAKQFPEQLDFYTMGTGFTWKSDNLERDRLAARQAWEMAVNAINEKQYDMIVLDELTYLIHYGMIDEDEIMAVLTKKPDKLHLVVTGRYASAGLLAAADLITEMKAVRHPYASGVSAQKGFEY